MLKYAETTSLILCWCVLISVGLTALMFAVESRRRPGHARAMWSDGLVVPALVVGPVMLVGAFRIAGINLLFPVHFFADFPTLVAAALVPALVLVVASGMSSTIRRTLRGEYAEWSGRPFAIAALAFGSTSRRAVRRLVIAKTLARAWSQCLPWLFGELIIVETVFNAPGLGLDAWHLARIRDFEGLATTVIWLAGLYGTALLFTALLHTWLGRRLESYA